MAGKPTILAGDDDPVVSRAGARDLRTQYGADSRVVAATSGAEALEVLAGLALRARAAAPAPRRPRRRGGGDPGRARPPPPRGRPRRPRPADARDDRHRVALGGAPAVARDQAAPAHGVLRHRGGEPDDQGDRPRPLPAEALGPAG